MTAMPGWGPYLLGLHVPQDVGGRLPEDLAGQFACVWGDLGLSVDAYADLPELLLGPFGVGAHQLPGRRGRLHHVWPWMS
ncbi:hypothetical protein ACWEPL_52410 [Nonomuraea sp. NPDC004186]